GVSVSREADRAGVADRDPAPIRAGERRGRVCRAATAGGGRDGGMRGFWAMLWKEFIQMRRDRLTVAMMVGIPAIQLALFGYAIRTDMRHLRTVVLDESRSQESRALVDVFRNTGNFDFVRAVTSREEIQRDIESGAAH